MDFESRRSYRLAWRRQLSHGGDKVNVEAADNDDSAHLSRSLSALIGREVRPAMVLHRACLEKADSNAQLSLPTKSGINEEKSQ